MVALSQAQLITEARAQNFYHYTQLSIVTTCPGGPGPTSFIHNATTAPCPAAPSFGNTAMGDSSAYPLAGFIGGSLNSFFGARTGIDGTSGSNNTGVGAYSSRFVRGSWNTG
jgi:hypothetical protein